MREGVCESGGNLYDENADMAGLRRREGHRSEEATGYDFRKLSRIREIQVRAISQSFPILRLLIIGLHLRVSTFH